MLMHCNKGYCSQEKVLEALRALGINIGRLLHPNGKDKKKGKARKKPTITMPRFCMIAGNPEYAKLANKYFKTLKAKKRKELADSLRVSVASLIMLGVGWKEDDQCYTFPEHNGAVKSVASCVGGRMGNNECLLDTNEVSISLKVGPIDRVLCSWSKGQRKLRLVGMPALRSLVGLQQPQAMTSLPTS